MKILTVKVNIPDGVKKEFCKWCIQNRCVYRFLQNFLSFIFKMLDRDLYGKMSIVLKNKRIDVYPFYIFIKRVC